MVWAFLVVTYSTACDRDHLIFVGLLKSIQRLLNAAPSESSTCLLSFVFEAAVVEVVLVEAALVLLFRVANHCRKGGVFQKTCIPELKRFLSITLRSNSDSHVLIVGETLQAKLRLSPFFIIQSSHSSKIP